MCVIKNTLNFIINVPDMLEFAVHNRVNYFEVEVLDGTWHSVCLAWKTADETKKTSYIYVVMDGKQISGLHTLAGILNALNGKT